MMPASRRALLKGALSLSAGAALLPPGALADTTSDTLNGICPAI
jgi:hypothetical protein